MGGEVDWLEVDRDLRDTRKMQEIVDERRHVLAGDLDPFSITTSNLAEGVPEILEQRRTVAGQCPERGAQVVGERIGERLQVLVGALKIISLFPLLVHVPYSGHDESSRAGGDSRQRDLRRKGTAVAAAPGQLHARPHWPGRRIGHVLDSSL